MAEKRILIADADANALEVFRRAMGASWVVVGAGTGSVAMAEAQKQSFDVVVANYDLPGLGGAELLNRLRVVNPKGIRFIAAAEPSREKVMCHVLGGHQFLAVPFDAVTLKGSIERSLANDYGMTSGMRELVARIRTFPSIPSLYLEVINALKSPNATTEDIGAILAKDMAMTTKLVQVLNSAYFGLSRTITDPTEAVGILGFETVKSLIMTIKVLSQYDKVKPVYFSIDNIWRHSTNVARAARVMALLETGDNDCIASAYTAGLMHDLGKVILAANFDSQYHGAHTVARKQRIPLWEVEKDIFGATHGEIGAYLLGLWGMSGEVVTVAAFHHHPLRSDDKNFTALTAVHVANALENEENPDAEGLPPAVVDMAYLQRLGLQGRLEIWREARRDPDATKFETKMQRAKTSAKTAARPSHLTPASSPHAERLIPVALPTQSSPFGGLPRWLAIGFGTAAALVLLARLEYVRLEHTTEKPAVHEPAQDPPPPPPPGLQQQTSPVLTPAVAVQETKPAAAPPTNIVPVVAAQPSPAPPPAPAVAAAPPKTAMDRLKLQAIFYTSPHPAALISGQLASVDQEVAGCRVLDISPSSVTLEYQHQRRTLTLR